MSIEILIWCNECGAKLDNRAQETEHLPWKCMPWKEGDPVHFTYGPGKYTGTVTSLGPRVQAGEKRKVHVEADQDVVITELPWVTTRSLCFDPEELCPLPAPEIIPA
jgi:hypothetical protein